MSTWSCEARESHPAHETSGNRTPSGDIQVDIDADKLAESKSGSKDVKAFAQRMIADHGGVNKAAVDLVHKLA
jgi:predicted outer membrane protein